MFVDSHAHLTSPQFDEDREEVIRRAVDAGVQFIVNPATDLDDCKKAIELADRHREVYACVGFHPHDAGKATDAGLAEVEELSTHPKVVAIGEIGLDFYYDFSPRDLQERVFAAQMEIASRRNLPVVIHTRDSIPETMRIVDDTIQRFPRWRGARGETGARIPLGVFHCFLGDLPTAWKLVRQGFYVSMGGIATFRNPGNATGLAGGISLEHFMLETDSPYLAPVPHRGKRNEPSHIPIIAQKIADLRGMSIEDVGRATNYNVHRLFGIGEAGKPVFTYRLRNSLYINLTIRCNADCVFCDRKGEASLAGHNLRIEREPTVKEVLGEIGNPKAYEEIVFCGYGEPTIRLDAVLQIARWVKENGGRTRLNTDGHGSIINGRNIVPEIAEVIDAVSISLNSPDPVQYGEIMRVDPAKFFQAMVQFARDAVRSIPRVTMTVVDLESVDKEKARKFVEEEVGAVFHTRPYF